MIYFGHTEKVDFSFIDLILLLMEALTKLAGKKGTADTIFGAHSNGQVFQVSIIFSWETKETQKSCLKVPCYATSQHLNTFPNLSMSSENWTQGYWVRSTDATSVLGSPWCFTFNKSPKTALKNNIFKEISYNLWHWFVFSHGWSVSFCL